LISKVKRAAACKKDLCKIKICLKIKEKEIPHDNESEYSDFGSPSTK
jgi:hypothetical protein